MPILRLEKAPYYITIAELSKLPVLEKLVMYKDENLRNKPLENKDIKILTEFIIDNIGNWENYRFQYIDLEKKEAECAITELILYHVYFFCKNTYILGSHRTIDTKSDQVTLNDIIYPYTSWNSEVIFRDITIKSGYSYFTIDYNKIEKVAGFFREFKVILKDAIITFAFGKICYEARTPYCSINVDKFFKLWDEKKSICRLLSSKDKRNYKKFAFYLNDKYIYSNYEHPRFYYSYSNYQNTNAEIFKSE